MRLARAGVSIAILGAATLCLQGCQGASPTNSTSGPGSSTGTPLPARPPAVLDFRPASFHLPFAVQREVAVTSGRSIYLMGGLNAADNSVATVVKVDPGTGHVQTIGEMPRRFHDGAGAVIGKRLLVFGGGTGTGSAVVQSFAPPAGPAEVDGSLPRALSDLAAATLGGVTYLVGGYDGITPQRTIYATSDGRRFRRAGLLPVGLRYPAVTGVGSTVVIAGGETTHGPSGSILAFDPSTGAVTMVAHLPRPLGHAVAFTVGGVVYVAGGVDGSGRTLQTIVAAETGSGRVSVAGKLPAPLSDAAVVVLGGQAWLFGGLRGSAVSQILVASVPAT